MSQEAVELLPRGIETWNRREVDVWLDLGDARHRMDARRSSRGGANRVSGL